MSEQSLTPEEVILAAFTFFQKDTLDLGSLVQVAMQANCPSAETAQGVLNAMVNKGLLTWRKEGKTVFFTLASQMRLRQ